MSAARSPAAARAAASPPLHYATLRDADTCVKCGLCLPHCPTYMVNRDEGDSPRGRIALMQGLATGMLGANDALRSHLDGCLTCRACEAVCPADVPYGRLIDAARSALVQERPRRAWLARVMAAVLTRPALRALVVLPLLLYQALGLEGLVRRVLPRGSLARLASLPPPLHWPRRPATRATTGEPVALFTNCTSPLTEPATLDATVQLLEAAGCRVSVPAAQTCCGALHQHAGLSAQAHRCAQRNIAAFAGGTPVIGIASGCTAQLAEYNLLLPGAPGPAAFARRAVDVHAFLLQRQERLRFRPLPARVLLHTPCTLRNVLRGGDAVRALLACIPELQVVAMEAACCGAAGSYFISQPAMADALLEPKLAQARREQPAYVLSSNVGCAMHLAAGLRRAGITAPVWHPARLLAQQLAAPGDRSA